MLITAPSLSPEEKKLAQMILYSSQKCATSKTWGSVMLNKVLFFSDFLAYGNLGKAISGVEYQNLRMGPAPRRLLPVRDKMIADKELTIQPVRLKSGNFQQRPVNLREPDLSIFGGDQIAILDNVIESFRDMVADDISELSHRMVGWKMTKEGETIPYATVFLSDAPLNDAEIKRGTELAAELGLLA